MAEKEYISRDDGKIAAWQILEGMGYSIKHNYRLVEEVDAVFDEIPAADVPPALWTGEPIICTEFMTHNQGQSGFEIHFRTDDKEKYEAVQDECRRQIGHAKPAADVRPVVLCRDCTFFKPQQKSKRWSSTTPICSRSATIKMPPDGFCSFGVKREES